MFDITLLGWYGAAGVHAYGAGQDLIKRCLKEASGWETPRPPFEVRC